MQTPHRKVRVLSTEPFSTGGRHALMPMGRFEKEWEEPRLLAGYLPSCLSISFYYLFTNGITANAAANERRPCDTAGKKE